MLFALLKRGKNKIDPTDGVIASVMLNHGVTGNITFSKDGVARTIFEDIYQMVDINGTFVRYGD